MITKSINVMNLNIPCACHCQYCLLSWENKTSGVARIRAERFAKRFRSYLQDNHPEMNFTYYFGYSVDDDELLESIQFMRSIHSIGGKFLQLNGIKMRNEDQTRDFLRNIKKDGIESIDLTFYGTREYHDRFAGRKGDFDFLIRLLQHATILQMKVTISIAIYKDNLDQMSSLVELLEKSPIDSLFIRIPSDKGKGISKWENRITLEDYLSLPDSVKKYINRDIYQTESEFLNHNVIPSEESRTLILSLTQDNIDRLEQMDFADILLELENMDNEYYKIVPSFFELSRRYGNQHGNRLYRKRDLYLAYQRKYIFENHLNLYDINDESQSCSFRSL